VGQEEYPEVTAAPNSQRAPMLDRLGILDILSRWGCQGEVDSAGRVFFTVVPVGTMHMQAGGIRVPDAVMQQSGNTLTFHLTSMAKQEGDQWTAWCPELDIAAQGDNAQTAVDALVTAINGYIQHMMKSGRVADIVRPASPEAYHEFMTAGGNNGASGDAVQVSGRALELSMA